MIETEIVSAFSRLKAKKPLLPAHTVVKSTLAIRTSRPTVARLSRCLRAIFSQILSAPEANCSPRNREGASCILARLLRVGCRRRRRPTMRRTGCLRITSRGAARRLRNRGGKTHFSTYTLCSRRGSIRALRSCGGATSWCGRSRLGNGLGHRSRDGNGSCGPCSRRWGRQHDRGWKPGPPMQLSHANC